MKAILFILLIIVLPSSVYAQNVPFQVSFTCQTLQPLLDFSYSSIDEMQQGKEIVNAIQLNLRLKMKGCTMMAKVDYTGTANTGSLPAGWMSTKLINNNAPNASIPATEIPLGNTNTVLFTQPNHINNGPHDYTFNYNLKLNALNSVCVPPATYNFTITYTMTSL